MTLMLGNYEFEVLAVPREDIKGCDGITYHCARKIEVADDLDNISRLEGAISDDGWIYETYDIANSIREKFKEQKKNPKD